MRELITGISTLMFIVAYNLNILDTQFAFFDCVPCRKSIFLLVTGIFVSTLILLGNSNKKTNLEKDLRRFAFGSFFTYAIITLAYYQYIIINPFKLIYLFNGLNFVTILLILYNAGKYGFLRNGR